MKIDISRFDLIQALRFASIPLNLNNAAAIIQARDERTVVLSAFDDDQTVCEMHAMVADTGEVNVPSGALQKLLTNLDCERVQLHSSASALAVVNSETSDRYRLHLAVERDVPLPDMGEAVDLNIDQGHLKLAATHTAYAADVGGFRMSLECVSWLPGKAATALSGHRMARTEVQDGRASGELMLIPAKSMQAAARLCNETTFIRASATPHFVAFEYAGGTYVVRRVNSDPVPTDNLIPTEHEHTVTCTAGELGKVVRRVAICSNSETPHVKLTFDDNRVTVTSEDRATGARAMEVLDVEHDLTDATVAVNPKYLVDAMDHMHAQTVRIGFGGTKPMVIRPGTQTYGHQPLAVIMPVKIKEEGE